MKLSLECIQLLATGYLVVQPNGTVNEIIGVCNEGLGNG